MKLSSARFLKRELLAFKTTFAHSLSAVSATPSAAARRASVKRTLADVALGISPGAKKGDFRLAVRLHKEGPEVDAVVADIRAEARGEVHVQHVGTLTKLARKPAWFRKRQRPLILGASIGEKPPTGFHSAGTLGGFVVERKAPHYLGLLTNNHVIAGENSKPLGSKIVQPGTLDAGRFPQDVIGELGSFVPLRPGRNLVDAAVGHLYEGVAYDPRTIGDFGDLVGLGDVLRLPARAKVHKAGRTTGETTGRITAIEVDNVRVTYDTGVFTFDGQIEIEGTGNQPFSEGGDSGSLIVDEKLRAIGLLFAGGTVGGSNGKGLTFANPIGTVLDALGVDLER